MIQRSFISGEIGSLLFGGADRPRYLSGLKTCRNFLVMRGGGVANRPGSQFVAEVKTSSAKTYLGKFIYNNDKTYALEFGNQYIRFYRLGARVTVSPAAWSGATAYVVGDLVASGGANYYCILAHTNQIPPNATYWYALTSNILEIPTPWATADLPDLEYVQSGDIITFTHRSYAPRELRRYSSRWTLTTVTTAPGIAQPDGGTGTAGAAGSLVYRYRVTAVTAETYEESLPGFGPTKAITGATQANPVVITAVAHGFDNGDEVYITGVGGMTEINGLRFTVANKTADTFELSGINGTGYGAYTSGGTAQRTCIKIASTAVPTQSLPNALSWTAVSVAVEYNVYLDLAGNGTYGFIGVAASNSFNDIGYEPDLSLTPPVARTLFAAAGDYPGSVTHHQQRRLFAGSTNDPETVWGSRTGFYKNFTISSPIQDDDAVTFTIAGRLISEVRHMIEVGKALVVLTSTGEWMVLGNEEGVLTPSGISLQQQAYWGAARVAPIVVGSTLVYVQSRGSLVRDLRFDINQEGYAGRDLTIFAPHLVFGYSIDRMDYAQIPDSIIYCVRSDGTLLGLTYLPEFDSFGWHRHDTDGYFEDVVTVPETTPPPPGSAIRGKEEDAVYVIVQRTINGATKRYVERFASRRFEDYRLDGLFLDCFATYNGVNAAATTVTLTTGAGWTTSDLITVTASAGTFVAGDVGNGVTVWSSAQVNRIVITEYVSSTVVRGNPIATVDASLRNTALTNWSRAVDEVTGLSHLEAKAVKILANGTVLSGTVSGGAITLANLYDVIHVGLAITADFETLDLDSDQENIRDTRKLITNAGLLVERSRGIYAGPDFSHLYEYVKESGTVLGLDVFSSTGGATLNQVVEIPIDSTWDKPGRIAVRQTDPLPLSILAVIPNGVMGKA